MTNNATGSIRGSAMVVLRTDSLQRAHNQFNWLWLSCHPDRWDADFDRSTGANFYGSRSLIGPVYNWGTRASR